MRQARLPQELYPNLEVPHLELLLQRAIGAHTEPIRSISFSPDGTKVVTISWNRTAKVWDVASGRLLKTLEGHTDKVTSAQFSPDGTKIVTASHDYTARIWNVESGESIKTLEGHTNWVISASFSPDGTKVVTTSWDKTAKIWDVATGEVLIILKGHTDIVDSAVFSSADKTAKIWNVIKDFELLDTLEETSILRSVSFSPDGLLVLTLTAEGTAKIWVISNALIKKYFSNKLLPLEQQALLVTLDTLSRKKNGGAITKRDLPIAHLFAELPSHITAALRKVYHVNAHVISSALPTLKPAQAQNTSLRTLIKNTGSKKEGVVTRLDVLGKVKA